MNRYDPMDRSEQEACRLENETRATLARKTEDEDIKWMMSTPRGRRIVWRILESAQVFCISFTPGNPNALQTAFNEGRRNEGLRLYEAIHRNAPEKYTNMVKENRKNGQGSDK